MQLKLALNCVSVNKHNSKFLPCESQTSPVDDVKQSTLSARHELTARRQQIQECTERETVP